MRDKEKHRETCRTWKKNNPDKVKALNDKHNARLINKYKTQQCDAKRRRIEWNFTFETWSKVWKESGHLEQRGTKKDEYCMCRYEDRGPYSPENVYITTNSQNVKDMFLFRELEKLKEV